MSAKKLLPLIVILAVLAGLVVLRKNAHKRPTIVQQVSLEQVIPDGMKTEDIERLELFSGKKPAEKVVVAKEGDAWKLTSHYNAPAKTEVVKEYLDALVKVKGEFRAEAKTDPERETYNLKDDQAFHVQAFKAGADKPAIDLLVGESPNYKTVFLRKSDGDRVYVESTNLRSQAGVVDEKSDKPIAPDKWLDKDIVKLEGEKAEKITKVALTMPDKSLSFERQEKPQPPAEVKEGENAEGEAKPAKKEYEWKLVSGGTGAPLKPKAFEDKILAKVKAIQATSVADPAKAADYGLATPAFKLVISSEGDPDIVVEGGHPDLAGNGYLRVAGAANGLVYELAKFAFDQIFPKGSDLFDLPKAEIKSADVNRIEINQPEGRIVAQKEGEAWKVIEPALALNTQQMPFTNLISGLGTLTATDYADANADLGSFDATVTLVSPTGSEVISRGGKSKTIDGSYVKLGNVTTPITLAKANVDKLFPKVRDVFELALLGVDEAKVKSLDIIQGADTAKLARGDAGWSFEAAGNSRPLDQAAGDDLISEIVDLQAADVTNPAAQPAKLTLTLALMEGTPRAIQIGWDDAETNHTITVDSATTYPIAKETVKKLVDAIDKVKKAEAPAAPAAPEAAVAPVVSTDAVAPVAPAVTVAPAAPAAPAVTIAPAAPAAPAVTIAPAAPAAPEAPAAPAAPAVTIAPAAPAAPEAPAAPAAPAEPAK